MAALYPKLTLKGSEKIGLISNLSTMLSAGIPIIEAVDSILTDTKGSQKKILETLKKDLMDGKRVYSAFANFPSCFDPITVNLIKAAEEAGTLETTLHDLKDHIQRDMEFSDRVKSALIYPVIIMFVFIVVLLMILIFVIPKISTVFKKLRIALPLPTRIMIFVSDLITQHTLVLAISSIALVVIVIIVFKKNRPLFIRIFSGLPLISKLTREIDLARFSRSLYLLLSSGIPITSALELSKDVIFRGQTADIIKKAREMIMSGKRFSDGLRSGKKDIPTIVVKLIEAGEKSGSLDKSMKDISEFFDYQVGNTLKNLTAIMEPVMLVMVGFFAGGMMLAIITPIYGLIGQIGAQ
jgi:type II secretory pathway component PulF